LDALHAVWNMARSEDLEVTPTGAQKRPVEPDEVIASHQRQGRFASSRVLSAALSCPPPAEPVPPELTEAQLDPPEHLPVFAGPGTEVVAEEAMFADPV